MEALNEKKRALVRELRARIEALPEAERPPRRHDLWLKRFGAHGKWKIDKCLKLYLEMEAWRKKALADSILEAGACDGRRIPTLPLDFATFYPHGQDRKGRNVQVMTIGHIPWWRYLFETHADLLESQLWMGEWFAAGIALRARNGNEWRERGVVIVDLSALNYAFFQGMASNGRARKRSLGANLSGYFPGIIDKAYIVNAPGFVNKAWAVMKMLLSEALMEKASLVASQAEKDAMLEDLGRENVPCAYGGTADAAGSAALPAYLRMPPGGWQEAVNRWRPTEILIAARAAHAVTVKVPAGGRVRWQWALLEHSVTFEVSRRANGSRSSEFESYIERREVAFAGMEDPARGEAPGPEGGGEVQLVWDNEAARMRSKTLLFRVEVL